MNGKTGNKSQTLLPRLLALIIVLTLLRFTAGNVTPVLADEGTPTPTASETVAPTDTPIPTETPAPTDTPIPTETPAPADTPIPTDEVAPEVTAEVSPTAAITETPLPDPARFISEEMQISFVLPTDWQVLPGAEIPPEGDSISSLAIQSVDETQQVVFNEYTVLTETALAEWIQGNIQRLPLDLQTTTLNDAQFEYPALAGYSPLNGQIFFFIQRQENILEIQYRSGNLYANLKNLEQFIGTLAVNGSSKSSDIAPDLAQMLNIQPIAMDVTTQDQKSGPANNDKDLQSVGIQGAKTLSIPYIDQVYVQYQREKLTNPSSWYLCGPSSLTMALASFGVKPATADATWEVAGGVLYNKGSDWSRFPGYMQTLGVTLTNNWTFPSYATIKSNIDAGLPMPMGVKMGLGHIVLVIGYRDPNIVIIHDPYGNKNWTIKNTPPGSTPKSYGVNVEYTYTELAGKFGTAWSSFAKNPVPAVTSVAPILANAADTTITVKGSGFVIGAYVNANGTKLATTFVSGSELRAVIPGSMLKAGGTISITVFTHGPGGGTSSAYSMTVLNPAPSIGSLSQRVINQSSSSLTISIYGSGFVSSSVARLNGTNLSTTYVSTSQLNAVIPSSMRSGVGGVNITVSNPAPGGGTTGGFLAVRVDTNAAVGIISYHSKKAIDLDGGKSADLTKIQQWDYSRTNNNQKWLLVPTGNANEFWIISPITLKCIDIQGGSKDNLAKAMEYTCHFGSNQRFLRIYQGNNWLGTLAGKLYGFQNYYTFQAVHSGKVLDVENWSTSNGAWIQQYTAGNKQGNQMWYVLVP